MGPLAAGLLVLSLASAVIAPSPARAGGPPAAIAPAREGPARDVLYRPPAGSEPRERVAGGSRSTLASAPVLRSLAPEHVAETISERPSLFWYLSGELPPGATLSFTLTDDAHIDPLVEDELPRPRRPGIQRIDLSQHGVRLERGTEYQWSVALVVDPSHRSRDIVTSGWIDRVDPPPALASDAAPGARRLAAAGLWYDALAAAVSDPPLRDALLRDAGLSDLLAAPSPQPPAAAAVSGTSPSR